jgi:diadenosine tetraphosphate (Ap4A) HIT family hydrolase
MSVDPFCTKSETDKTVFYESANFMVLYDIKPVVRGHCLFIPKRHVIDLPELKKHEQRELWELLCSVIPRILKL